MTSVLLVLRFLAIVGVFWLVFRSASYLVRRSAKRQKFLDENPVSPLEVEEAVKRYGRNTNSVVHLYGALSFFKPPRPALSDEPTPLVGYVSFDNENIMVTDPLCRPEDGKEILKEFVNFSQREEKDCLVFAVDSTTARQAGELGFGLIQIGSEPAFDLKSYSPEAHPPKMLSAVRQVYKKGFVIEEFTAHQVSDPQWAKQFREILAQWFLSRRADKMYLLSEVSPFKEMAQKKYFVARHGNRVEAFLACSPIFAKNGFFIHDLIRRPNTVNGISEALILCALKTLKEQNFNFASLGIASLAGLDAPGVNQNYHLLNRILVRVFNKHQMFMRFKSLYHFKKKFDPSFEEPAYLAFYPPQFKLSFLLSIGSMFSARGLMGYFLFKWRQWQSGTQLPRPIAALLSPEIVTLARPVPFTFGEFLTRSRFTCFMFFLNVYTYLHSVSRHSGNLEQDMLAEYGFNFDNFFSHKWYVLVTSNFLHFNYFHLMGNMFLLLVFGGTLEFIGGTTLTALAYLLALNANIPTAVLIHPLLKLIDFYNWHVDLHYLDVGASLGVMGVLGALLQFVKYKERIVTGLFMALAILAILENNFLGMDHSFALLMGYFVGYAFLNRGYPKSVFQSLFVSYDSPFRSKSAIPFRSRNR